MRRIEASKRWLTCHNEREKVVMIEVLYTAEGRQEELSVNIIATVQKSRRQPRRRAKS